MVKCVYGKCAGRESWLLITDPGYAVFSKERFTTHVVTNHNNLRVQSNTNSCGIQSPCQLLMLIYVIWNHSCLFGHRSYTGK